MEEARGEGGKEEDAMPSATVTGRQVIVGIDGEQQLIIEVEIDCEVCGGRYGFTFPGHHLLPIRDLILAAIADNPTLVGPDSRPGGEVAWRGTPPKDPSVN
jgi:hypothetical protein